MLHGFVPRPRLEFYGTAIELTDEVLVLVELQPVKEITSHTITLTPRVATRAILAAEVLVEATTSHANCVGKTFDKEPVLTLVIVAATTFRGKLIGMGKLVIEDAASLVVEAQSIVSSKAAFNPICAVTDTNIITASVLLADAVVVLNGINDALQARYIRVFRSPIKGLQNTQGILLNVRSRIRDDVVVNL